MQPDLTDPDLRWYVGDPADVVDALAELLLAMQRPAWMRRAACRGMDTAAWFPTPKQDATTALTVCNDCPVRVECAAWALEHREHGLWGGTDEQQRRTTPAA